MDARVAVGHLPVDVRTASATRAEAVHAPVRDDVDRPAADREGVLDLLAGAHDSDASRLRIERADLPILLRHEPDAPAEVRQRGGNPLIAGPRRREVVVGHLAEARAAAAGL